MTLHAALTAMGKSTALARRFPAKQQALILEASLDQTRLEAMPINEYFNLYVI